MKYDNVDYNFILLLRFYNFVGIGMGYKTLLQIVFTVRVGRNIKVFM